MVQIINHNRHSDFFERIGTVSPTDWASGSFWVPVTIDRWRGMFARHELREL